MKNLKSCQKNQLFFFRIKNFLKMFSKSISLKHLLAFPFKSQSKEVLFIIFLRKTSLVAYEGGENWNQPSLYHEV